MKDVLNQLFDHKRLSKEQAKDVLINISKDAYNPSQIAAFISVYLMRGISIDELRGFREALLELCIPVDLDGTEAIDVCGTGGDGKNTFNVSTLSAFVIAGAGYKVAKHGNYGVSSACGSSNVLEYFGYKFTTEKDALKNQLEKANICFFHAPLFHPALKTVGPIRRQLGVKTFFNMLGPLVNPAQPTHQMVGVFNLKLARLYQYLFEEGEHQYAIVHSLDGYDEISLTDSAKVISSNRGEYILSNGDIGMPTYRSEDIIGGGTISEAAHIFTSVLQNAATKAQTDVVIANAGMAIDCFKNHSDLDQSMEEARRSLLDGRAMQVFEKSIALCS